MWMNLTTCAEVGDLLDLSVGSTVGGSGFAEEQMEAMYPGRGPVELPVGGSGVAVGSVFDKYAAHYAAEDAKRSPVVAPFRVSLRNDKIAAISRGRCRPTRRLSGRRTVRRSSVARRVASRSAGGGSDGPEPPPPHRAASRVAELLLVRAAEAVAA